MTDFHWLSAIFSPTGGTAAFAKAFPGGHGHVVDLSVPAPVTPVADSPVLLAAAPVFGGRIPAVALERLAALSHMTEGTLRAYEDRKAAEAPSCAACTECSTPQT